MINLYDGIVGGIKENWIDLLYVEKLPDTEVAKNKG